LYQNCDSGPVLPYFLSSNSHTIYIYHLIFADDICVFSPSISGLQCLLNICGDYAHAAEHEITFKGAFTSEAKHKQLCNM